MVVEENITNWSKLAEEMRTNKKDVQKRWKNHIYDKIKHPQTIGGFHKYSTAENNILNAARQNGLSWD